MPIKAMIDCRLEHGQAAHKLHPNHQCQVRASFPDVTVNLADVRVHAAHSPHQIGHQFYVETSLPMHFPELQLCVAEQLAQ